MKNFAHGGDIYRAMREDNSAAWLDFSANINPLGLADSVRAAIETAVPDVVHYPDVAAAELKRELCRQYALKTENLLLGNGAVELLYLLCQLQKPRRVLIAAPSFNEYERASRAAGAAVDYLYLDETDGFSFDLERLKKAFNGQEIFFWGNPNNPTATLLSKAELARIAAYTAERDCIFVVDQSFLDFREDAALYSAHPLLKEYPNLFVLHSLTKFYALPGLRLGFASAAKGRVAKLELCKDPWNVNSLAQAAGAAALRDLAYQETSRKNLAPVMREMYRRLQSLRGIFAYAPTVNFILIRLANFLGTAAKLKQRLAKKHILIRDCANYPGLSRQYARFAVRTPDENERLLTALKEIVEER